MAVLSFVYYNKLNTNYIQETEKYKHTNMLDNYVDLLDEANSHLRRRLNEIDKQVESIYFSYIPFWDIQDTKGKLGQEDLYDLNKLEYQNIQDIGDLIKEYNLIHSI